MKYPGDTVYLILSLTHSDGTDPSVTTAPSISIVNAATNAVVQIGGQSSANMSLVPGTFRVYKYGWYAGGLADGTYLAIVSYAADGVTVQGRLLQVIELGDSRITSAVAQDSTVAKDATVAKDSTVFHLGDYVAPHNDASIIAMKATLDALPVSVASQASLDALTALVNDVRDVELGNWNIDSNGVMTFSRISGSVLARFQLTRTTNQQSRIRQ